MLAAIDLNHQATLKADEICHKWPERMLVTETMSVHLALPEMPEMPEMPDMTQMPRGAQGTQGTCSTGVVKICSGHHA